LFAWMPPDILSLFLLAMPLLSRYGLSIGVAYVFRNRQAMAGGVPAETPQL